MTYSPDRWVLVDTGRTVKVFGTWFGGYTRGDEWRLNSGCVKLTDDGDYYTAAGFSGSVYKLYKNCEGTSAWSAGVLRGIIDDTNFRVIGIDEAIKLTLRYEE